MLTIDPEGVCYIIVKASEAGAKAEPVDPGSGSNPTDDKNATILEDFADDPTLAELMAALLSLNVDEVAELLTLTWLGSGEYDKSEWKAALAAARQAQGRHAPEYIAGTRLLADYLEEGLSQLDCPCERLEIDRL